LKIGKDSVATT